MTYKLPEPARFTTKAAFTATQMHEAYAAGRQAGLEEAIDAVLSYQAGWVPDGFTECADVIRNVKEAK